jgi:hypothetical protein
VNNMRRISPICPQCKKQNTYDIIPLLPNSTKFQLHESDLIGLEEFTVGNAKYHCVDCGQIWKKYRGKKPYERIKTIHAYSGGYPGPYFNIKIDLELMEVEINSSELKDHPGDIHSVRVITKEDVDWFRSELYKCDFVNWAEEYIFFALDGTHWSVRIEYDTHCEMKTGSNHFPPNWTKFRKAVSKLSGSEFY